MKVKLFDVVVCDVSSGIVFTVSGKALPERAAQLRLANTPQKEGRGGFFARIVRAGTVRLGTKL